MSDKTFDHFIRFFEIPEFIRFKESKPNLTDELITEFIETTYGIKNKLRTNTCTEWIIVDEELFSAFLLANSDQVE